MEQELNQYWEKFVNYWNQFVHLIQQFIEYGQKDETAWVVVFVIVPLLLFLLTLLLILSVRDRYVNGNRGRKVTPYDPVRVQKYNENLAEIVGEGNVMVEMLENEIRENQNLVTSLREEVDALREERKTLREEIRLMEESPTELADSLKRDNEQKLLKAHKKGNYKALKMMFLGLFLGFLMMCVGSGIWMYQKHPDTLKAQFSDWQTYVTSLWQKQ